MFPFEHVRICTYVCVGPLIPRPFSFDAAVSYSKYTNIGKQVVVILYILDSQPVDTPIAAHLAVRTPVPERFLTSA